MAEETDKREEVERGSSMKTQKGGKSRRKSGILGVSGRELRKATILIKEIMVIMEPWKRPGVRKATLGLRTC